eukprot:Pgem_evm1s9979
MFAACLDLWLFVFITIFTAEIIIAKRMTIMITKTEFESDPLEGFELELYTTNDRLITMYNKSASASNSWEREINSIDGGCEVPYTIRYSADYLIDGNRGACGTSSFYCTSEGYKIITSYTFEDINDESWFKIDCDVENSIAYAVFYQRPLGKGEIKISVDNDKLTGTFNNELMDGSCNGYRADFDCTQNVTQCAVYDNSCYGIGGQRKCLYCNEGFYALNNRCVPIPCHINNCRIVDEKTCTTVPECIECEIGHINSSDKKSCLFCPEAPNCESQNFTTCQENGNILTGNTCSKCETGFHLDQSYFQCDKCQEKTVDCEDYHSSCFNLTTSLACAGCKEGFTLISDNNECQFCPEAPNCLRQDYTSCPQETLNVNLTSVNNCSECNIGFHLNEKDLQCDECQELTVNCTDFHSFCFNSASTGLACARCQESFALISETNECKACQEETADCVEYHSSCLNLTTSLLCARCKEGFTLITDNNECQLCPKAPNCLRQDYTPCPEESVVGDLINVSKCSECSIGFHLNENNNNNKCQPCYANISDCAQYDEGCFEDSDYKQCSKCSPTHFLSSNNTCQLCTDDDPYCYNTNNVEGINNSIFGDIGSLVGTIIGIVVFIAIVVFLLIFFLRRWSKSNTKNAIVLSTQDFLMGNYDNNGSKAGDGIVLQSDEEYINTHNISNSNNTYYNNNINDNNNNNNNDNDNDQYTSMDDIDASDNNEIFDINTDATTISTATTITIHIGNSDVSASESSYRDINDDETSRREAEKSYSSVDIDEYATPAIDDFADDNNNAIYIDEYALPNYVDEVDVNSDEEYAIPSKT